MEEKVLNDISQDEREEEEELSKVPKDSTYNDIQEDAREEKESIEDLKKSIYEKDKTIEDLKKSLEDFHRRFLSMEQKDTRKDYNTLKGDIL